MIKKVVFVLLWFTLVYFTSQPFDKLIKNQEPITISQNLNLPTKNLQLVDYVNDVSSFTISFDDFIKLQLDGVINIEVKSWDNRVKTNIYSSSSGMVFKTSLSDIVLESWGIWGINLGTYTIKFKKINSGVLTLYLIPAWDTDIYMIGFFIIIFEGIFLLYIFDIFTKMVKQHNRAKY